MNKEQILSRESSVEGREQENLSLKFDGKFHEVCNSSGGPVIDFRSEQEERDDVASTLQQMRSVRREAVQFAAVAPAELAKLIECMRHQTGQGYKLRKLLYSLWSGRPGADLSDVLSLDWELRKSLMAVLMGWGCSGTNTQPEFFYAALEASLRDAKLMNWFCEEGADK